MAEKKNFKSLVTKVKARIEAGQKNPADNPAWVKQTALLTGVLAAISGFLVVRSTAVTNNAIYESNQAILSQTEAGCVERISGRQHQGACHRNRIGDGCRP